MNKYCFLVFCLLFVTSVFSQTITVKEEFTGKPLQDVYVYCYKPLVSAVTNTNGQCDISEFADCDSIVIELIGYEKEFLSFDQLKNNNFLVYLSEKYFSEKQIVVSATRWQQEQKDIPNKISTIRPLEIQMQNPQTAADLIGTSGEVFIQKSQLGGGSPMIRGFAANRVLISVDGIRMNNSIFRSGNLQNIISIDPFSVQKAEILFGPGSVIYGSDAIGGTMSFITKIPQFQKKFYGNASARISSANFEKTGHIDFNIGFDKWAFLTSASISDFDNLTMGSNGPDDYLRQNYVLKSASLDKIKTNNNPEEQLFTQYNQLNLMQKIRYKHNQYWDFKLGLYYSKSSDIPRYDRLLETNNDTLKNAEWYYGPQLWYMNTLSADYKRANLLFDETKISIAMQYFEESRHDRKFNESNLRHRYESLEAVNANLDFNKVINETQNLYYGFEVITNKVGSEAESENIRTGSTQSIATRYPDNSKWNSYAAYLTYQNELQNNLILNSGMRYNYISISSKLENTFFSFPFSEIDLGTGAVTGSFGVVYSPQSSFQVKFNLATGFRAPNVDDVSKVFDSEPGAVVVPNPKLKSEYAYNVDFGFTKTFTDFVRIDITGFYTILDDALVKRNFSVIGMDSIIYDGVLSQVQSVRNAAQTKVYGVQAGFEIKLPNNFSVLTRVNYQKGEEELDSGETSPLRHAAPLFASARLFYKNGKFRFDLYSLYNAEISNNNLALSEQNKPHLYAKDSNGNPYSPDWYTINLKVNYNFSSTLSLNFGIENILDKRYRSYSSGIAAPGRNFISAVNYTF
jgi:outer membrane receptor protein involved in Fe transport